MSFLKQLSDFIKKTNFEFGHCCICNENIQNNNPPKSYKEKNIHSIMINDSNDKNIDNNIIDY
jgi:type IV secretory pathway component VirB8